MNGKSPARRTLGRGLDALLGGAEGELVITDVRPTPTAVPSANSSGSEVVTPLPIVSRGTSTVPVGSIRPGKYQPRRHFAPAELEALAQSIKEKGVLQPILIRPAPGEDGTRFELVAGERRWRAAQMAQLHEIPALVRELTDRDLLEIALVENLQRQDLTPIEEAEGYRRLMEEFAHSQEHLGQIIGKSRSHVANMMRLLTLPEAVQGLVQSNQLSMGHARALIGLSPEDAMRMSQAVTGENLSVRDVERRVQLLKTGGWEAVAGRKKETPRDGAAPASGSADIALLERELGHRLGMKVTIDHRGEGGRLIVDYKSLEQLDDVIARLQSR